MNKSSRQARGIILWDDFKNDGKKIDFLQSTMDLLKYINGRMVAWLTLLTFPGGKFVRRSL
jgi:hypothetical protein